MDFIANVHPLMLGLVAALLWLGLLLWPGRRVLARVRLTGRLFGGEGCGLLAALGILFVVLGAAMGLRFGRAQEGFGTSLLLCFLLVVLSPLLGLLLFRAWGSGLVRRGAARALAGLLAASAVGVLAALVWSLGAWPPLVFAVRHRHAAVVRTLLGLGADPSARNRFGQTPVDWAVTLGDTATAGLLLDRGARPTRIHLLTATLRGEPAMVALLLRHGASPDAADDSGRTPLMVALERCDPAVAQLLLDHGAGRSLDRGQVQSLLDACRRR